MIPSVLQKKLFAKSFPGHVNWGFENHALIVFAKSPESFRSKYDLFSFKLRNFTEKLSIFHENFFVKMFSWTRRKWFLKPCLDFILPKSEFFYLKVKKITEKIINFLKVFREKIPSTLRLMFWKPCRKCFAKVRNFSAQVAKKTEKQGFFKKKNPQSLHLDSQNAVLTHLGESFFSQKPKIFWSKYGRDWQTKTFPKKVLNLFPWTRKLQFRKP